MTGNLHAKLSSNSPNVNYIENYIFEWAKSSDGHMTYWNINLTTKVNEKIEKKAVTDWGEGSGGGGGWGGGGGAVLLKQTEAWRAEKNFFETAPPPPYLRVWMTRPPPLPEGLNPQLKRDNGDLKRAWMSSIREVQNVLGQVIFKINEPKKIEHSNSREEWGIE